MLTKIINEITIFVLNWKSNICVNVLREKNIKKNRKELEQILEKTIGLNIHLSMLFGTPCNSRLHLVFHSNRFFYMNLLYSFFHHLKSKTEFKYFYAIREYTWLLWQLKVFFVTKSNQQNKLKKKLNSVNLKWWPELGQVVLM